MLLFRILANRAPGGGLALPEQPASSRIAKKSWPNPALVPGSGRNLLDLQQVLRFNSDEVSYAAVLRLSLSTHNVCLSPQKPLTTPCIAAQRSAAADPIRGGDGLQA